ncbi:protein maelstrom homolog [Halyomorpha halys]|uniref:protein maelstrom homolog n=1 Tax=Halyomorpha halys TaxID=286706 RepID=UPI0006D4F8C1|nr:protein maelstrom homolog [Halyomorpha halys]XP_014294302.1 protein maelstrom homolog [Halyomorpha halys]
MAAYKATKVAEDPSKKFTSFGVSYATLEAEKREKEHARKTMIETIKNTLNGLGKQSASKNNIFFLCHANYFYKTQQQFYYPAEIAFSAFSLKFGLIAAESFFVDPGKIPEGYKHEASEWSSRTHGIPINDPNWKEGLNNPLEMYAKIRKFIKKYSRESEIPPFYSMLEDPLNTTDRFSIVECALSMITDSLEVTNPEFRIYCLPLLVFEILNKCSPSINTTVPIIKRLIERDVFSYTKDIGCPYHEKKDLSIHCSLSIVKRWVFTVCDLCCKYLGINSVIGRHVPNSYTSGMNNLPLQIEKDIESRKYSKGMNCSESVTPLTIIDHGRLKEQRGEERRVREQLLQKWMGLRLPKRSYKNMTHYNLNLQEK